MARRKRSSGYGRLVLVAVALVALATGGWFYVTRGWHGTGPLAATATVTVPEGATLAAAARAMEKAGAIRSTTAFLRNVKLFGTEAPIRAGEYAVPAGASEADILDLLQNGKALQRLVIVPEGMPAVLVRDRLMAQPLLAGSGRRSAGGIGAARRL